MADPKDTEHEANPRHNPKACKLCRRAEAEMRHPSYLRIRRLMDVPGPRNGTGR